MANKAGKIASRYARALLKVSDSASGDLSKFCATWKESKELKDVILNPMFDKSQRQSALVSLSKEIGVDSVTQRFLAVVFEKDRIGVLPEIVDEYIKLADIKANNVEVSVKVAREISEQESRDLEKTMSEIISGNLNFDWQVDESLIGGILVQYQGKVLDGTIKGKLDRIEKELLGAQSR